LQHSLQCGAHARALAKGTGVPSQAFSEKEVGLVVSENRSFMVDAFAVQPPRGAGGRELDQEDSVCCGTWWWVDGEGVDLGASNQRIVND
jgi:hypothetical protein